MRNDTEMQRVPKCKDARRKKRMATVTFLISQHARGTEDKTEKYSLGGNKNGKI
jgi:hypothetical protein